MAGWFSVAVGVVALGLAGFAVLRRWSPRRWGGLYKHFATGSAGLGVAMTAYGASQLTGGAAQVACQVLSGAGFILAIGTLLHAYRVAAPQD
jgi:hypothetical protein